MIQDSKANNSDTRLLLTSFDCCSNMFFGAACFPRLCGSVFLGGQIRDDSQSRLGLGLSRQKKDHWEAFFLLTDKYQLTDLFFWIFGWDGLFLSPYLENVVYLFFWKHVAGFSDLGVSSWWKSTSQRLFSRYTPVNWLLGGLENGPFFKDPSFPLENGDNSSQLC